MVVVSATPRFVRAYGKLTAEQKERVDQALRTFMENPRHPGLHFERLKASEYRTIRVDRKRWRIVMRGAGQDRFDLIDVDVHKAVDRQYG